MVDARGIFFPCFCHPHIILTNFLALLTRNTMGKFNKGDFHDSMKIFTYVHYNKGQSSLMRSERNSTKHGIYISTFFFADTLGKMQNFNISIVLLGPKYRMLKNFRPIKEFQSILAINVTIY